MNIGKKINSLLIIITMSMASSSAECGKTIRETIKVENELVGKILKVLNLFRYDIVIKDKYGNTYAASYSDINTDISKDFSKYKLKAHSLDQNGCEVVFTTTKTIIKQNSIIYGSEDIMDAKISKINCPSYAPKDEILKENKNLNEIEIESRKNSEEEEEEDKLDVDYSKYIATIIPKFQKSIVGNLIYQNFNDFIENSEHLKNQTDIPYKPGKYLAHNDARSPFKVWLERNTKMSAPSQGWKIHVTAVPKSALKIAKIVVPILEKEKAAFKICVTLPSLRTLNMSKYIKGSESQAGKFIAIYPKDDLQAYNIASLLVKELNSKISNGELASSDFISLTGDANLGNPGVFVRYGLFGGGKAVINRFNQKVSAVDNRDLPWPDFMNTDVNFKTYNPFRELELKFKNYSWKTREQYFKKK